MSANDLADLKHKSVRGGMITFVSQGASVIIGLVSTVVLARLLSPDDYGVMAMVLAVTAFAGLFRDLGLSSAAIQKHTLTNAQQTNLFWVNVALGSALTIGFATASPRVVCPPSPGLCWCGRCVLADMRWPKFVASW
jgi:PST family polysaccharide transporter